MRKAREEDTHETDRFPVADTIDLLHSRAVSSKRNLELIPGYIDCFAVT